MVIAYVVYDNRFMGNVMCKINKKNILNAYCERVIYCVYKYIYIFFLTLQF